MAVTNSFSNNSVILTEFMAQFQNNLQFALTAGRNFTEDYKNKPMRKGATVQYRLPYQFDVGNTLTVTPQNTNDRVRSITVDQIRNIALEFNGIELTLEDAMKDPFAKQYQLDQMNYLANSVETYIGEKFYKKARFAVGTPGSTMNYDVVADAYTKMVAHGIPVASNIFGGLNATAANELKKSVKEYFNTKINTAALYSGYLGELSKFQLFQTNALPRHVAGIGAAGTVTAGKKSGGLTTAQITTGSVITVDGLGATAAGNFFNEGDIIELSGVYSVNELTKQPTNDLMQFSVTANVAADGSGACSIPVFPAIVTSGKGMNCQVIPDNTQVNLYNDHNVSLFYHREALYYASPILEAPRSLVIKGSKYDSKYRMGITYSEGADIKEFTNINRIDHLFGIEINPEFLIRGMN